MRAAEQIDVRERIAGEWLKNSVIAVLCLCGVLLNTWVACNVLLRGAATGLNDFRSFYAGGRLAGTSDLYNPAKAHEVQIRTAGETGESLRYIRLPYFALLLKPLSWLPYRAAYAVWECLTGAALAAFIALWPAVRARAKWLVCCWSLPAFVSQFNGQDVSLVLLWMALAAFLLRRGRPLAAGAVMALCASKYNLVTTLPLVILAQRRWRAGVGAAVMGGVLLALSFAAAGLNWPWQYLDVLRDPRIHPSLNHMPNLHAFFAGMRFGSAFEIAEAVILYALVFAVARRAPSFEWPLALALAAGLLLSVHSYLADCALLLPALALSAGAGVPKYVRIPAIMLATPVPWFFLQLPPPLPAVTLTLIAALVFGMSFVKGSAQRACVPGSPPVPEPALSAASSERILVAGGALE